MMKLHGLFKIAAIADHMPRKSPFALHDIQNLMIQNRRNAVNLIIGGHNCLRTALCDCSAERLQIILVLISFINGG